MTTRAARAARAPPAVIRAGEGSLRTDDQREDARQGRGRPETRARFLRCASALGSTRRASSASASTRAPRQAAGCEALSWPPRRGSFAASEATSVPAKGKAIVKKSASGWPTGGRRMSDRADATHRHRSRCRRRTARARASDCHPLGTKVNCLSWWALTCPRERQPENIRSRSVIESYIRTRHELAPVRYSPSCAVVPARYSNPTALVLAKKGELLVRYSYLVVFLLVHGRVKKTRTRPWTGTGQVRFRARTSTGSARCRRLPEVELAHELELVRGLNCCPRSRPPAHPSQPPAPPPAPRAPARGRRRSAWAGPSASGGESEPGLAACALHRAPLAGRPDFFRCWRVLANLARRGRVYD